MVTNWDNIFTAAKSAGAKFPELVAAQWALESAYGKTTSGKNNFFGIKGKGTKCPTQEVYNGKTVNIVAEFQDFASPEECIKWLVDRWYKDYKGYKGVNNNATVELAAKDLVKQGYATDPNYAEKLLKIAREHNTPVPAPQPVAPVEPQPHNQPISNSPITAEKFVDFFKFFDPNNSNHVKAVKLLYSRLPEDSKIAESEWVVQFRSKIPQPVKPSGILEVPYFSQRKNFRDQERTCFATCCAMLVEYFRPGTLKATHGKQGDDSYLDYLFSIGDTTDSAVEVRTLAHFGVNSRFVTNGTFAMIDAQLAKRIPVPVGILHHGTPSKPSGGHWIVVIGKIMDSKAPGGCWYVVNDPYGEINHANGTYTNVDGKGKNYSKNVLVSRWAIEGDGSGWAIVAQVS
jgi:hypothetical protein